MISGRVEPDGTYEVALDEDGDYSVYLAGTRPQAHRPSRDISTGCEHARFLARDATVPTELTVRVSGADPSVKIDLDIRSSDNTSVVVHGDSSWRKHDNPARACVRHSPRRCASAGRDVRMARRGVFP